MLRMLFGDREDKLKWKLAPKKYPRDSRDNCTGKIILPQGCLVDLVRKEKRTPYAFKVSAHGGVSYTHAGVHDFTGDQGDVVLPAWMYEQLAIDGAPVAVTLVELPQGQYVKLLPQEKEFLEVENPKGELELALRHYQVLSQGDTIELYFQGEFRAMAFTVVEVRPSSEGVSIIDTDLEVDFLPPANYTEEHAESGSELLAATEDGKAYVRAPGTQSGDDSSPLKALGVVFAGMK